MLMFSALRGMLLPCSCGFNLRKCSFVAIERRDLAGVNLPALDDYVGIGWIQFHEPRAASEFFARDQRGSAAAEKIQNDIASLRAVLESALDQRDRLHRRVQPVGGRLRGCPQRRLCLVAEPAITLPAQVAVEDRLMLKFVAAESPPEGVFGPDDLRADAEGRGLERVLKFPLKKRRVANVEARRGLHRAGECA